MPSLRQGFGGQARYNEMKYQKIERLFVWYNLKNQSEEKGDEIQGQGRSSAVRY